MMYLKKYSWVLGLLLLLLIFYFSDSRTTGLIHVVEFTEEGFMPATITIQKDDSITFVNGTEKFFWPASDIHPTHGIYPEFDPKEPVAPSQTWTFAFRKPGTWRFHDHLSPYFTGTVTVSERTKSGATLMGHANDVIALCGDKRFPPSCYDEEIPKLMDYISMEDAFEVTRIVQEKDPKYLYCHVLGHKLSYRESEKDPSKWKEVLTRCPTTMCNNGCLHGSLMQRFNSESLTEAQIEELIPEVKDVCEPRGSWHPVRVEQSMCYHAIGHLFMYVTNADMRRSAELCEVIGKKDDGRNYVQTCTEGVFMQVFQPLEPEDFALVKDIAPKTPEEAIEFCKPYEGRSFYACRREAWPLSRTTLMEPGYLDTFCAYTKGNATEERTCYAAIMNMVTVNLVIDREDAGKLETYCRALQKPERQAQCFAAAATRLVQIDPRYTEKAGEVCEIAAKSNLGSDCFRDLAYYATSSFHPQSEEFMNYCNRLPEPAKSTCMGLKNRK